MRKLLTTIYAIGVLLIGLASPIQALEYKLKIPSQSLEYILKIPDDRSIKKITVYTVTYYLHEDIPENKPTFSYNQIETLLTDGTEITDIDHEIDGKIDDRSVIKTIEIDEKTKRIERYLDVDDDDPDTEFEKTFYKDGAKITEIGGYADGPLNETRTEKIVNGVKITDIDLGALGRVYERRLEKIIDGKKIIEIYPYADKLLETKIVQEKILEIDL